MFRELNNRILKDASRLDFTVKAVAPSTINEVLSQSSLVVWNGASESTIWNDPSVNYAFRALHDALHIESRLGFNIPEEIELGRIQASKYDGLLSDLVFIEVSGQADYFLKFGSFVADQYAWTLKQLKGMGWKL